MLKVGEEAPQFTLPDQNDAPVSLADYRGRHVVLVFYPGDNTPVCTTQLCEFRDAYDQFQAAGAVVLGVNSWGPDGKQSFIERHSFPFRLLVDQGCRVSALYGTKIGIGPLCLTNRSVYVIGPDGKVRFAQKGKPNPKDVLAALSS